MPPTSAAQAVWDDRRLSDPHGQPDKARRVQAMFDAIAPTYERVNRILSAGRDAHWRRRAVAMADMTATDRVLDLACGTGDFTRAFAAVGPAVVIGTDFAERMLTLAAARGDARMTWCRADALALPFADGVFDIVSCAFGVRNFQNLPRGLREAHRVLSPGGRLVILEFSTPRSAGLGALYLLYLRRILPRLAGWISGDRSGAYRYLPRSVLSFPDGAAMADALRAAGFADVSVNRLSVGIVTVYVARKRA